ncbi:MAG: transposase [Thioploca sp.]|nr:transposase [Thioploca sp.]
MIFAKPLPFISEFIEQLNQGLQENLPKRKLSRAQRWWLSFCLMGIVLSGRVCWAEFERIGLGGYGLAALSWMFRHSKLPWSLLLHVSMTIILRHYGISEGELAGDDTEKKRAKLTKRIDKAHQMFDKKTGGYINGQEVVILYLITAKISLPVGFEFYQANPELVKWRKEDEALKKPGVNKSERPPKPARNPNYPTKVALLLNLLEQFKYYHPNIQIKAIVGDALYGSDWFMKRAAKIFAGVQVISQLQKSQVIQYRNREMPVAEYFAKYPGVEMTIRIRGVEVQVVLGGARLYVKAHGQKRFVVALKYEGQEDYRYLVASDMSWRAVDLASAYTLRWLIEVFFEDWKLHEGWGRFALQYDEEGSSRSLALSLLSDYALLLHPDQSARIKDNLPAYTVGSLKRTSQMDALVDVIRGVVDADDPHQKLNEIIAVAQKLFPLRNSAKHMSGRDLGRLEPTPSLKYRAPACMA